MINGGKLTKFSRRTTFNNRKQLFLYLFCYPGVAKARDTIKISINKSLTSSNNLALEIFDSRSHSSKCKNSYTKHVNIILKGISHSE